MLNAVSLCPWDKCALVDARACNNLWSADCWQLYRAVTWLQEKANGAVKEKKTSSHLCMSPRSSTCRGSPWRSWNTFCFTPFATTWRWRTSRTSSSTRRRAWRRTPGTVRQSSKEVSWDSRADKWNVSDKRRVWCCRWSQSNPPGTGL